MTAAVKEKSNTNIVGLASTNQCDRARKDLLEHHHDLTTRKGILDWLASVGLALTHDLPEMPRQKANTAAYVSSVALKAIQQ